ncbi:MAG: 1-phosphofructokinase family hexose kinase [Fusobacteria bacterium]|nr:1-phosphofructokinase family hexose kinase [Fusobacteriota bacterium]
MIYSISLNSSIDYVIFTTEFDVEGSSNSVEEFMYPGGKGINVARVLTYLDIPTKILGFVGGFTGRYIEESLKNEDVLTDFIHTRDRSRVNVKIKSEAEYEINGVNPAITQEELTLFFASLSQIKDGDLVLLCGKVAQVFSSDIYVQIMEKLKGKKIDFVVDTTDDALLSTLVYKPLFIKPNLSELETLFNVKISHLDQLIYYGNKLIELGAQNVVVSLASEGAILITKSKNTMAFVPSIEPKNSVGAGDSLVAGMVYSLRKGYSLEKSFRYGVAMSVNAVTSKTLFDSEEIDNIYEKIRLKEL